MEGGFLHFLIQEELSEFGPGAWYRASDLLTDRVVALGFVEVAGHHPGDPEMPPDAGLLPILEYGATPEAGFYLVTELSQAITLDARMRQGRLSVRDCAEIARRLASALQALHRSGSTYGPLDPQSIQLEPGHEVRLFPSFARTESAERFQAPEVAAGGPMTVQADIWSLGVLMYTMISGRPPFVQHDPAQMAYAIRFEQPPPLRSIRRGVPSGFERIVHLALAKRPEHRYQTMGDLLLDLENVSSGGAPRVATPYRIALAEQRTGRGSSRRRTPPVMRVALVAFGVLLLILVGYVLLEGRAPWMTLSGGPVRLAVMPFHDLTYRPEALGWPIIVQRRIAASLGQSATITVLEPDSINAEVRARVGTTEARRGRWLFNLLEDLDVAYLVDGGVYIDGKRYLLRGQVIQRWSAEVLFADTAGFRGAADLEEAAGRLASGMQEFLRGDTSAHARQE